MIMINNFKTQLFIDISFNMPKAYHLENGIEKSNFELAYSN